MLSSAVMAAIEEFRAAEPEAPSPTLARSGADHGPG
jgi:hypothetical protein